MTTRTSLLLLLAVTFFAVGCTTEGQFVLPPGTEISIYERPPVKPDSSGQIVTKPFFWTAIAGVKYELFDENGDVVKSGKLRAKFRVVSIFWPPFALLYWPAGINPDVTHDLTQD